MKEQSFVRGYWPLWIVAGIIVVVGVFLGLAIIFSPGARAAETEEAKPWWIEVQAVSRKQPARAIIWYERELTSTFGFFAFMWKESDRYRELLIGPTWKPLEDVQLGCGVGREYLPDEGGRGPRSTCFVEASRRKFSLAALFENGRASGSWNKTTVTYTLSERFGMGLMHETDLGNGPRLEWNVRKDVQIWAALLRGNILNTDDIVVEKKLTALLAVNFSF